MLFGIVVAEDSRLRILVLSYAIEPIYTEFASSGFLSKS